MKRRTLLSGGAALATASLAGQTWAQAYPNRPVRWVLPYPPGGPTDGVARKLAELVSQEIGQPVVIDNKVGAGGVIGTAEVVRAAPDGYTLGLVGPDPLTSGAILVKSAGYDPRTDITRLMQVSYGQAILFAHQKLGISSITELLALGKSKPGTVTYASWGPGSRPELMFKAIEFANGGSFVSVPYRGLAPMLTDLLSGTVMVASLPVSLAMQYQEKGIGTSLGVLGQVRAPEMPQLKTSQEQGVNLPIMDAQLWNLVFGPKGLPADIRQRWVTVLQKVTASPAFAQSLRAMGQIPTPTRHTEWLERDFAAEYAMIADLIQKAGYKPA